MSQEDHPKAPALLRIQEVREGIGHPIWSQGQNGTNEQKPEEERFSGNQVPERLCSSPEVMAQHRVKSKTSGMTPRPIATPLHHTAEQEEGRQRTEITFLPPQPTQPHW